MKPLENMFDSIWESGWERRVWLTLLFMRWPFGLTLTVGGLVVASLKYLQ